MWKVVVSARVRHNGRVYNPGDEIKGLGEYEADRLERLGVVASKVESDERMAVTVEGILGAKAADAVQLIAEVEDVQILAAVQHRETRKTVLDAATERLAFLSGRAPESPEESE